MGKTSESGIEAPDRGSQRKELLADTHFVESPAETGMAITVVHRTQPPVQYTGEISASRRTAVAVRFEKAPNLDTPDEMLLIIGPAGARSMATGKFVASQGNVVAFTLLTSWQQLDLRKSPRRALDGMVEVRSVLGQSRQEGYITDISTGGIAVTVRSKPGGNAVELKISRDGFASHIRCRVASVTAGPESVTLHMEYDNLSPPQQAFIRQLVASAAPADEGDQRSAAW
jgi:hypothetical protein